LAEGLAIWAAFETWQLTFLKVRDPREESKVLSVTQSLKSHTFTPMFFYSLEVSCQVLQRQGIKLHLLRKGVLTF
jgi:hypothetical protein